jgi:hypothetical protein
MTEKEVKRKLKVAAETKRYAEETDNVMVATRWGEICDELLDQLNGMRASDH